MRRGTIRGQAELLAAAGHHPYARFVAGASRDLRGVQVGDAVFWHCVGPFGPFGHAMGSAAGVAGALAEAEATGLLDGLLWVNLPGDAAAPAGWTARERWDYHWLAGELALPDAAARVRPATDQDALRSLLDEAYPHSELRPGHPLVRQWYGIELDGRLVACAADRTVPAPEPDAVPTGVIGGVAVHPAHRGHGLGAAVTAGVAAILQERHDLVGLGVTEGNDTATRVYERLGFTGRHRLLSVLPA